MRVDGRKNDELRKVKVTRNYITSAYGSVLISMGATRVICTATPTDKVPPHIKGTGAGWVTAEYSMLPASTQQRMARERLKVGGRTQEIQRLIGRSLRAVVDLKVLGEMCIMVDCDVIQADGGTRTASINGAFLALADALKKLKKEGKISGTPLKDYLGAVSAGIVNGVPMLDLCYTEDSEAEVDTNVVMTGGGRFVEVQSTGEEYSFSEDELKKLINLAGKGISEIIRLEKNKTGI